MRLLVIGCLLLGSVMSPLQAEPLPGAVKDPFYGQVLFDFHQQNYFSAITHLRASQQQGRLPSHYDEAELLLGGLYLSYGMQKNAEIIFSQLQARQIDPQLRDRVWLALAGIYAERGYETTAAELLGRITGPLPASQEDEKLLLESSLLTRKGDYSAAAALLAAAKRDSLERAYGQYNLALEQIRLGHEAEGRQLLEPLARLDSNGDSERSALRDKASITLGYSYLRREQFTQAHQWFERVGLNGPFAGQALLGLGWVEAGLGNGVAALSVWLPLIERNAADPSVLEGLLAVPYTLNQLGDRRQAADYYKKAINAYDKELKTLEGIISGLDFKALAQELVNTRVTPEAGWQWRAEIGASAILGPYIYPVMAGHEFQEALRNYRDLLYLDKNLEQWQRDLDAYESMVYMRQAAYEGRLPTVKRSLAVLEQNQFRQQRDGYAGRLHAIETEGDHAALASSDEQQLMVMLARIEARLKRLEGGVDLADQQRKFETLKGMVVWQLETDFPVRLWQLKRQLQQLDESLAASDRQHQSLTSTLARSPSDFKRYRQSIKAARSQMIDMQQQGRSLAQRYEARLQQLTVAAIAGMEARIKDYHGQALFAAAQIYDSALHAQREQQ